MCVCVCVTPVDQMSDKSGFDIWRECHLKPNGLYGKFIYSISFNVSSHPTIFMLNKMCILMQYNASPLTQNANCNGGFLRFYFLTPTIPNVTSTSQIF